MQKRSLLGMVLILVAVGAAVLVYQGLQQPSPSNEITHKFTLGAEKSLLTAAVWVAENKGYFKDEGLDVEIKGFESGKASFVAMLEGKGIDISTVAPTPIMFQSFKRDDFSVLGTFTYSYEDVKVIGRKDRKIATADDLKGKKIGTPYGTTGQFFVEAFLTHNGLSASDVQVVDISPSSLPAAIQEGKVDAIVIWEPHAYKAQQILADNAVTLPSSNVYKETFNFMAMNSFAKRNPQALEKFLSAIQKATAFIKSDKTEAQSIVAQRLNLDTKVMEILWEQFVFELSLDQSLLKTLEDEARWAIQSKLVDTDTMPNYLGFIHTDALTHVSPQAVGLYTQSAKKIRVAEASQPAAGLIYIADKKGYFEGHGLEVELQSYGSGKACLDSVMQGRADFATVAETPIMHACLNQRAIHTLASINQSETNLAVVARVDKGIELPEQLVKKKIGVTKGTNGEFFLDLFLAKFGILEADVEVVDLTPEQMPEALGSGQVDAVAIWNPHVVLLKRKFGDKVVILHGRGLYRDTFNIAVMQRFAKGNPDTAEKFLHALVKAANFVANEPNEARGIIASSVGMEESLLAELWNIYQLDVTLNRSLLATMRDQGRWAIRKRLTRKTDLPDFMECIDAGILQQIDAKRVTIED